MSTYSADNLIILGAGAPHLGNTPSAINPEIIGESVIEWQLSATRVLERNTLFVSGYMSNKIKSAYPHLNYCYNNDWNSTGSCYSLLTSPFDFNSSAIVTYGDIIFRTSAVHAISDSQADVSFAWDSKWEQRYMGRELDSLSNCEKVFVINDQPIRLGSNLDIHMANGEFVGLVRFSPKALSIIHDLKSHALESFKTVTLSDLIEYLRAFDLSFYCHDIRGDWAELRDPHDLSKFIMGTKAETLHRLQGVLRHALIKDQVSFTVDNWSNNSTNIITEILSKFPQQKLVVRSSCANEDTFESSSAGVYDSILNVRGESQLYDSISKVIDSYKNENNPRDQALVQPMVENVLMSGVAFTKTMQYSSPWLVINYELSPDTSAITSGHSERNKLLYLYRNYSQSNLKGLDKGLAELVQSIKEIEIILNYEALDIEFAIDSSYQVFILQVRPLIDKSNSPIPSFSYSDIIQSALNLYADLKRPLPCIPCDVDPLFGLMPDWNPAEIIGISPSALALSLYKYLITDEVWSTQRAEYGYRDVSPTPLLHTFAGHPYIDVRASFASFLPASLSDSLSSKLLKYYIKRLKDSPSNHDKVEFNIIPTCVGPNFSRWERELTDDLSITPAELEEYRSGLTTITYNAFLRYKSDISCINELDHRYRQIRDDSSIRPIHKIKPLIQDCRRLGTLPFAHLARAAFISMALLKEAVDINVLSTEAYHSFLSSISTISKEFTSDGHKVADGSFDFEDFKEKYGHLRPGTYDITSKRYDSDPSTFLEPVCTSTSTDDAYSDSSAWLSEREKFFDQLHHIGLTHNPVLIEDFLRSTIQGREYAKFIFSRNISYAFELIVDYGSDHGLDRVGLSNLSFDFIIELFEKLDDSNSESLLSLAKQYVDFNSATRSICESIPLPALITDSNDFYCFTVGYDTPNFIGSSRCSTNIIRLDSSHQVPPDQLDKKIVLIPNADPGFDWIFAHNISGLITKYGGANSHMAIRAAEFSLPAAIGVGEALFFKLVSAEIVELDPANQTLRCVR